LDIFLNHIQQRNGVSSFDFAVRPALHAIVFIRGILRIARPECRRISISEKENFVLSDNSTAHWENVYSSRAADEVSWYQSRPELSLDMLRRCVPGPESSIIDIGGGDSTLADHLLASGYRKVTVLDISASALERAKHRLGPRADEVTWLVEDVTRFEAREAYDVWHDRAAFHFLTDADLIERYLSAMRGAVKPGGAALIATFSEQGPAKCSGLNVRRYSERSMAEAMAEGFEKQYCISTDHITPKGVRQNFIFCLFRRTF
jgi:SAM-dependent methyltransferase